jgi:hypothetical protein
MPWVRIDENALEHPKISGLSDGAFRLWVQGLACCQKYLTDGFVSDVSVRGLRAYSPKRRGELVTSGLWHEAAGGVNVHDYLEWNESRDHVISARHHARERLQKHRLKRGSQRVSNADRNAHSPVGVRVLRGSSVGSSEGDIGETHERELSATPPDLVERAGRFCNEVYPQLYVKHRNGARYAGKPSLDFQEAIGLCQIWDDSRLETLAIAFLTTDDKFCRSGTGSIAQFRSRASWCDSKLRERGL